VKLLLFRNNSNIYISSFSDQHSDIPMKEPNYDNELVLRLREGEETAFRMVFDMYSAKLYNFSYSFLKNREQCQEIIQEVFLNLWINRARLDDQYPIKALLYTITRRLTLNSLRQISNSRRAMDKLWLNMQQVSNETEERVYLGDLERFTEEAVTKLPKQQQQVFRMSRQQELSYDEIAEELHISRNTVKNHLVAAIKSLRAQFQKAFFIIFF
jgi:RNA polymerase sigma-70 factor (family 1)